MTIPKPFHLSGKNSKNATQQAASPYVPIAERLKMVEKTPDRFKTRPKKLVSVFIRVIVIFHFAGFSIL